MKSVERSRRSLYCTSTSLESCNGGGDQNNPLREKNIYIPPYMAAKERGLSKNGFFTPPRLWTANYTLPKTPKTIQGSASDYVSNNVVQTKTIDISKISSTQFHCAAIRPMFCDDDDTLLKNNDEALTSTSKLGNLNKNSSENALAKNTKQTDQDLMEIMRHITVYVEVRTGEDNRSAGVKKVISVLGARINDRLLRNTTHVIFKDGLLSTYRKAKNWNIPIVSILWIEACKNEGKICDPKDFPISNLDRYENPELYEKMKRYKSMQPDEGKKRAQNNKNSTPKTNSPKKPTGFKKNAISTPITGRQADISQYFAKLSTAEKSVDPPKTVTFDSPATQYLNRISTVVNTTPTTGKPANCANDDDFATPVNYFGNMKTISASTSSRHRNLILRQRRIDDMATSVAQLSLVATTPLKSSQSKPTNSQTIARCESMLQAPATPPTASNELTSKSTSLHRRRTTFSSKTMDITEYNPRATNSGDLAPNQMNRRRTLFTPRKMEQTLNAIEEDRALGEDKYADLPNDRRSNRDKNINNVGQEEGSVSVVIESTLKLSDEQQPHAPTSTTVFSSTQVSNRRRTLFDISLDMITHQVQNINEKAKRRSMAVTNINDVYESTNKADEATTSITLSSSNGDGDGRAENAAKSATTNVDGNGFRVDDSETGSGNIIAAVTKKRKLFIPNENAMTPPQAPLSSITSTQKRRRTLMPTKTTEETPTTTTTMKTTITQTAEEVVTSKSTLNLKNRRSTMYFEPQHKTVKRVPAKSKLTKTGVNSEQLKQQQTTEDCKERTDTVVKKCLPVMVCTNMHKEQMDTIRQTVESLGGFVLEKCVSDATTHVVSLEPRRTLNLVRGLIRGLWILDYRWVVESSGAGAWLHEEPFELNDFSKAIKICRAERQAFGSNYRCELFRDLGSFYVSSRCGNIPKHDLIELIQSCSGKITENRRNAKYFLCSACKVIDDKFYVTPQWILDSITQMQLMKLNKYSHHPVGATTSIINAIQQPQQNGGGNTVEGAASATATTRNRHHHTTNDVPKKLISKKSLVQLKQYQPHLYENLH